MSILDIRHSSFYAKNNLNMLTFICYNKPHRVFIETHSGYASVYLQLYERRSLILGHTRDISCL